MSPRPRKSTRSPNARFQSGDDPQRHLVYDWEDTWRDWQLNTLTLTECRYAVRTACKRYGIKPPRVKQHNRRSLSWCDGKIMSLQAKGFRRRGGKNLATVLHETAHCIVLRVFGHRVHDHGPTFLGVFLWLLEEARVAPRAALFASARSHGLRWREMSPVRCRR